MINFSEENRSQLLNLTGELALESVEDPPFVPGSTPVPVSGRVLSPEDFVQMVDSVLDGWLTGGRFEREFQSMLAKYVGVRNAVFVNSGSSANLAAISALTSPKLGKRAITPGDEVITVAAGFPTTVNPILQNKLTPVFVDIDADTLNANPAEIEKAISGRTKAIVLAHTLGNPFELDRIQQLARAHNLWLVEDSCDALGSTYRGARVGSFGDLATLSFYPAHHITTGEGGAVLVSSPLLRRQVESFRDWGRDCYCETGADNTCKKRFGWKLGDLPDGYDHKYTYSHLGYNLKATDIQASLGLSQLRRVDEIIQARRQNFEFLRVNLSEVPGFRFAKPTPNSNPAWFGFPITLDDELDFDREDLLRHLESLRIGTRLLFGGNLARQPAYLNQPFRVSGSLEVTDKVARSTFWLGVYPGLTKEMLTFVCDSLKEFVARRG